MAQDANQQIRRRERAIRNDNPTSERVCYFLRHHPAKDQEFAAKGEPGGWFKYEDILGKCRQLTETQLDRVVATSRSFIPPHAYRFESRTVDGVKWVRARYGHSYNTTFDDLDRETPGDCIPSLTDLLMQRIIADLPQYLSQLAEIEDGSLITSLFQRYKRVSMGKTSNKIIKAFLLPQVSFLDFRGILVEESIIRVIPKSCPSLYMLSMEGCFTCMTDTNLQYLLKRCTELRQLDISGCKFLSQAAIKHIIKLGTQLTVLAMRWLKCVGPREVRQICSALPNLEVLNITGCTWVPPTEVPELQKAFPNTFIQFDTIDVGIAEDRDDLANDDFEEDGDEGMDLFD